jgi:hypothetical protein
MFRTNVHQRFRRPEKLEMKATYARRTTIVKNYGNQNAWQTKSKTFPVKRIAVHNAYDKVREVAAEFKVPCVKKTFGNSIVRVSCRTIQQLDNIGSILEKLMTVDFIMEIGMPLEYSYKMKSLVLFIKPKNEPISNSIENVFQKCKFCYRHFIIEVEHPSVAADKFFKELETNNSVQEGTKVATIPQNGTKISIFKSAEEEKREMEQLYTIVLILTMGIMFLLLYIMFDL